MRYLSTGLDKQMNRGIILLNKQEIPAQPAQPLRDPQSCDPKLSINCCSYSFTPSQGNILKYQWLVEEAESLMFQLLQDKILLEKLWLREFLIQENYSKFLTSAKVKDSREKSMFDFNGSGPFWFKSVTSYWEHTLCWPHTLLRPRE